jgi:hypothetical protein
VIQSSKVEITVGNLNGKFVRTITASTFPDSPMGNYRPVDWSMSKLQYPHMRDCRFEAPSKPARIDLLIGASESLLH